MERRIPFGAVGSSIGTLLIFFVLLSFFVYLCAEKLLASPTVWDFWSVLGTIGAILFTALIYFLPSILAYDVSSRIEEIEELRAREGLYKSTVISHKYFWIIFILNIFFAYTGIVWLILFFWAHAPATVIIPDLIATKIKEKNQPDLESKSEPNLESNSEPDLESKSEPESVLESKLQEVKNLAEKGLLTEDEASIRRKKIISEE